MIFSHSAKLDTLLNKADMFETEIDLQEDGVTEWSKCEKNY